MGLDIKFPGIYISGQGIDLSSGGTDNEAFHKNRYGEFEDITEKIGPSGYDYILIEDNDSYPQWMKRKIRVSSLEVEAENIGQGDVGILVDGSSNVFRFKSLKSITPSILTWSDIGEEIGISVNVSAIDLDFIKDGTIYKKFLSSERTKLSAIENNADVTTTGRVLIAEREILVNEHADLNSTGQLIDSAVSLRHEQNSDTALGVLSIAINMGGNRIMNLADPGTGNEAATKNYVDTYSDNTSFHKNIPQEIRLLSTKQTPSDNDVILLEDSIDSWNKKKIYIKDIKASTDLTAIHTNISNEFVSINFKSNLDLEDILILEDGTNNFNKAKVLWANINKSGIDSDAVHLNVPNEFVLVNQRQDLSVDDRILIESSLDNLFYKNWITVSQIVSNFTDINAIHIAGINEFENIPEGVYTATDWILVEDILGQKKKIAISSVPTNNDPAAIHREGIGEIYNIQQKMENFDEDFLIIEEYNVDPVLRTKKRLRIGDISASSGGEINYGIGIGSGIDVYTGKDGSALIFRSLAKSSTSSHPIYFDKNDAGNEVRIKIDVDKTCSKLGVDKDKWNSAYTIAIAAQATASSAVGMATHALTVANTAEATAIGALSAAEAAQATADDALAKSETNETNINDLTESVEHLREHEAVIDLENATVDGWTALDKDANVLTQRGFRTASKSTHYHAIFKSDTDISFQVRNLIANIKNISPIPHAVVPIFKEKILIPDTDLYDAYFYKIGPTGTNIGEKILSEIETSEYNTDWIAIITRKFFCSATGDGGSVPIYYEEDRQEDAFSCEFKFRNLSAGAGIQLTTQQDGSILISSNGAGGTITKYETSKDYFVIDDTSQPPQIQLGIKDVVYTCINKPINQPGVVGIMEEVSVNPGNGLKRIELLQLGATAKQNFGDQLYLGREIDANLNPWLAAASRTYDVFNHGEEGESLYFGKTPDDEAWKTFLNFRKLRGGANIILNVQPDDDSLLISSTGGGGANISYWEETEEYFVINPIEDPQTTQLGVKNLVYDGICTTENETPWIKNIYYAFSPDAVTGLRLLNFRSIKTKAITIVEHQIDEKRTPISLHIDNDNNLELEFGFYSNYNPTAVSPSPRIFKNVDLSPYIGPDIPCYLVSFGIIACQERTTGTPYITRFGTIFEDTIQIAFDDYKAPFFKSLEREENLDVLSYDIAHILDWGNDGDISNNHVIRIHSIFSTLAKRTPTGPRDRIGKIIQKALPGPKSIVKIVSYAIYPGLKGILQGTTAIPTFYGVEDEGFVDEDDPGTLVWKNVDYKNTYNDPIIKTNLTTVNFDQDTIEIEIDPKGIRRLGTQVEDLDMGNKYITNLASPTEEQTDRAATVGWVKDYLSPFLAMAHDKDHDIGTDPLEEDLDLGGVEGGVGYPMPHKIIHMEDPDINIDHHGVNVGTLKSYVGSSFNIGELILKGKNNFYYPRTYKNWLVADIYESYILPSNIWDMKDIICNEVGDIVGCGTYYDGSYYLPIVYVNRQNEDAWHIHQLPVVHNNATFLKIIKNIHGAAIQKYVFLMEEQLSIGINLPYYYNEGDLMYGGDYHYVYNDVNFPGERWVTAFQINTRNSQINFASTYVESPAATMLYRSGSTFDTNISNLCYSDSTGKHITCLAFFSTTSGIFCRNDSSNLSTFFYSNDVGFTWSYLSTIADKINKVVATDTHLIAISDHSIYKSDDNGNTWGKIFELSQAKIVDIVYIGYNTLIAHGYLNTAPNLNDSYLWISYDNGTTWGENIYHEDAPGYGTKIAYQPKNNLLAMLHGVSATHYQKVYKKYFGS